jgi:hypothetical protein
MLIKLNIFFAGQIAIANPSTKGNGEAPKRERKRNGSSKKIRRKFNRYAKILIIGYHFYNETVVVKLGELWHI